MTNHLKIGRYELIEEIGRGALHDDDILQPDLAELGRTREGLENGRRENDLWAQAFHGHAQVCVCRVFLMFFSIVCVCVFYWWAVLSQWE